MVFSHPFFVYAFLAFLFVAFFASKSNKARRGILMIRKMGIKYREEIHNENLSGRR